MFLFGLSFPEFSKEYKRIGSKIRVFALSKEELEEFDLIKSLSIFSDYVHCTRIRTVPPQVNAMGQIFSKTHKNKFLSFSKKGCQKEKHFI